MKPVANHDTHGERGVAKWIRSFLMFLAGPPLDDTGFFNAETQDANQQQADESGRMSDKDRADTTYIEEMQRQNLSYYMRRRYL